MVGPIPPMMYKEISNSELQRWKDTLLSYRKLADEANRDGNHSVAHIMEYRSDLMEHYISDMLQIDPDDVESVLGIKPTHIASRGISMASPYGNSPYAHTWLDRQSAVNEFGDIDLSKFEFIERSGKMLYNKAGILAVHPNFVADVNNDTKRSLGDVIHRSFTGEIVSRDVPKRILTAVVADDSPGRHGIVIDPQGIDLTAFKKNPVVLFDGGKDPHRGSIPVGRAVDVWVESNKMLARVQFANDAFSQELYDQHVEKILTGWDVGVLQLKGGFGPPTKEERALRPELEKCVEIHRRSELTAISAISIAGDTDCRTVAVGRSMEDLEDLEDEDAWKQPERSDAEVITQFKRAQASLQDQLMAKIAARIEAERFDAMEHEFMLRGR